MHRAKSNRVMEGRARGAFRILSRVAWEKGSRNSPLQETENTVLAASSTSRAR